MAERIDRLCVLGLAASGRAVAEYAARRLGDEFGSVTVFDSGEGERLQSRAEELRGLGVDVRLGVEAGDGEYDLCVASPGIPPAAPLFQWGRTAADRMISEIEFAFERSDSPWVAITGTNGKTTTTSLVSHLLDLGGMPARTVGNIGRPAIDEIDDVTPGMALVAEVSSFQLALTERFCPRVAVLLNITPDHLDWHGSMEAYAEDKARIFTNMGAEDTAIIDVDDPVSAAYADPIEARGVRVMRVSRHGLPAGGAGISESGMLALDTSAGPVDLVAVDELLICGDHNVSNALAGAAAAHAFGVPAQDLRSGLRSFKPIEHRLEPVAVVGDVEYFNDSKATNPDAVLKALTAFGDRSLVLLLGGRNKGNDFKELAAAVAARARAAIVFGESRHELAEAFTTADAPATFELESAPTMAAALEIASGIAVPGEAVVLSPACASFDEFADYTERGRIFKELVSRMGRGEA